MRHIAGLLIGLLLFNAVPAVAQDNSAQLHVLQIFDVSANVFLDGELIVEQLAYPTSSDYLAIPAGSHTIAVARGEGGLEEATTLDIELSADHDYLLVALNTNADFTAFDLVLIDETAGLNELGDDSTAPVLILNDTADSPALDITVDDEIVVEDLNFGDYAFFSAPVGEFEAKVTTADAPNSELLSTSAVGLPNTFALVALLGVFPNAGLVRLNSTSLTIAEYLAELLPAEGSYFKTFYEALMVSDVLAEISGEGPFTLFVPTDAAIEILPELMRASLLTDPVLRDDWLRYHIVAGSYPPYRLPDFESLTTLQGTALSLTFPAEVFWRLNGSAQIIDHIRLPNGIIYEIDATLMPPMN